MEYLRAFLVGGAICAVCQVFIDYTKATPARILVSLVVLGVALGALGVYEPFAEWAGGGATVPLLGFGNLIARGTREAVGEKGILGALSGGLTAAAAGVGASLVFALLAAVVFRPKGK